MPNWLLRSPGINWISRLFSRDSMIHSFIRSVNKSFGQWRKGDWIVRKVNNSVTKCFGQHIIYWPNHSVGFLRTDQMVQISTTKSGQLDQLFFSIWLTGSVIFYLTKSWVQLPEVQGKRLFEYVIRTSE